MCANMLGACSTNPATGKSQFTALMSPGQELQVGAQEHSKIQAQFGFYDDPQLDSYVRQVGAHVTKNTERPDVQYQFHIIDSPMINAFALPGGYIYISRGLLALANDEAEMAAVLAHETGHITARHSAERYSHGVLTSLGASILSIALDSPGASDVLGLGSNLYLSSYSRGQEREADSLGLRYMTRGGYAPDAMAAFLNSLQSDTALASQIKGTAQSAGQSYFSTHPATAERIAQASAEAKSYTGGLNDTGRDRYLNAIDGMVYGDSAAQGFVRGQTFYHPGINLRFDAPPGFEISNGTAQVVATSKAGAIIIFDMAGGQGSPAAYLTQGWMKGEKVNELEEISVNGQRAATASIPGTVNGRQVTIRLMAVEWSPGRFARLQIAIPAGTDTQTLEALKRASYSLRKLSANEKASLRPYRIKIITAGAGDTLASLARRQPFTTLQEERFRVLNGLAPGEDVRSGRRYKLVME